MKTGVVIIIHVETFFGEAERRDGADQKPAVKRVRSAVRMDHTVDEIGRQLRLLFQIVGDTTIVFQLDRIGETNSGQSRPKTARVDAQQQGPRVVIVEIVSVERAAQAQSLLMPIRIHHLHSGRKPGRTSKTAVETQYFLGEVHPDALLKELLQSRGFN